MSEGYDVRLASALKEEGYDYTGMARLIKAGELIRVRHGAYAITPADDALMDHRRLIVATVPRCGDICLSHASAAVLHCLPTWAADLDRVHAIKWGGGHGPRGRNLHVHAAALDGDEIVRIGGVPVTCLARTVVDCARTYPYEKAVPIGDAALRAGLLREELERALQRARNRTGISRARRVTDFLDGRTESVGESRSRITFSRIGIPMPEPQFEIVDRDGRRVARTDFGWESQRTVGEFDGKIKYGRLIGAGEKPEDAVFREKVREDRIRDLGWEVVRWTWVDLEEPRLLATRLQRAFSRGLRRST